jgi:hypothetical protein
MSWETSKNTSVSSVTATKTSRSVIPRCLIGLPLAIRAAIDNPPGQYIFGVTGITADLLHLVAIISPEIGSAKASTLIVPTVTRLI